MVLGPGSSFRVRRRHHLLGRLPGLVAALSLVLSLAPRQVVLSEDFSEGWRSRWKVQQLSRRVTRFEVLDEGTGPVLRGTAERAAAALWIPIPVAPPVHAMLAWRWKVEEPVASFRSERQRHGDDYAARLMVAFGSGPFEAGAQVIAYVWARAEHPGARFPNPYRPEVATLVLRGPEAGLGEWLTEHRDLEADYRELFGEAPPEVNAIAFVVDSDDTGGRARGLLDELRLTGTTRRD